MRFYRMGKQKKIRHLTTPFRSSRAQIKNLGNSEWCKIYGTFVDVYAFRSHLNSPQHNRKLQVVVQDQLFREKIGENGIRIEALSWHLGWETIVGYFQKFGKILAISKLNSDSVIVQFEDRSAAEHASQIYGHTIPVLGNAQLTQSYYSQTPTLLLSDVTVAVHSRRVDEQHLSPQTGSLAYQLLQTFRLEQELNYSLRNALKYSLNEQLFALSAEFEPKQSCKVRKEKIMGDISSWLFLEYPHHLLWINRLGLDFRGADVEFYLNYDPAKSATSSKATKLTHLKRVGYILSAHPDARMCDLMCSNLIGVKRSQFIAAIQTLDTRIRPYFIILNLWARFHNLLGNPFIALSSYSLILLALFHLQRTIPSMIPPIVMLQSQIPPEQKIVCDGWNLSYHLPSVDNSQIPSVSLFCLIKGFFEFYKSFDPKNVVICPLVGDTIPHEKFLSNPAHLDETIFGPYLNTVKSGGQSLKLKPLTLQDPFELNNNVTSLYTNYQQFRSSCEESYKICCYLERLEDNDPASIAKLFIPVFL